MTAMTATTPSTPTPALPQCRARPDHLTRAGLAVAASLALATWAPAARAALPASYSAVELVPLGMAPGEAEVLGLALNNQGQVVGRIGTNAGLYMATVSNPLNGLTLAVTPANRFGSAVGINDAGLVAVTMNTASGSYHPFTLRADGSQLTDIGALGSGNTFANAVNSQGQVVGLSLGVSSDPGLGTGARAFITAPGAAGMGMRSLGTLGGLHSYGNAINGSGQVAGYSTLLPGDPEPSYYTPGVFHAFLSDANGGTLRDLGTLPGDQKSLAMSVNDHGQVVGNSGSPGTGYRAFVTGANGQDMIELAPPSGWLDVNPHAIDNAGHVLGSAYRASANRYHAFMTDLRTGEWVDLNDRVALPAGLLLESAMAINASGQIVVQGWNGIPLSNGRSWLMTPDLAAPVPEAPASAMLAAGLLTVALLQRRRR